MICDRCKYSQKAMVYDGNRYKEEYSAGCRLNEHPKFNQEYEEECIYFKQKTEKSINGMEKKEQSHDESTDIKKHIQSLLIQNTKNWEGVNYTKLKNKTYAGIKKDVIKDPFIYGAITPNDIKREIDRQAMMLIALGLLESINGFIFNPNKIRVGEHIPTVIKKELGLYQRIYKEAPVEGGIFR